MSSSPTMVIDMDMLAINVLLAIVVHTYYKRYEPEPGRNLLTVLFLLVVLPCASALAAFHLKRQPLNITIFLSPLTFYASLLLSIAAYRLSPWHPLAKYPGPVIARLTKFRGMMSTYSGKNHIYYKELHDRYGPCVRVGPNELSIIDAENVSALFALPRSKMYTVVDDPVRTPNIVSVLELPAHAARRRPWNRAFKSASIKGYEPILTRRALQLVNILDSEAKKQEFSGKAVDVAEWIRLFAFDFSGDLAFGGGFETMRDGPEKNVVWNFIERYMVMQSLLMHIPWVGYLLFRVPLLAQRLRVLSEFASKAVTRRKELGSDSKDLFHYLIDEDGLEKERPSDDTVMADGIIAVLGGADTTSLSLIATQFELITHPDVYERLREEIDSVFPPDEEDNYDSSKLANLPLLNAVIFESMRLLPPGNVLQRTTNNDTGPKQLGDYFVPSNTRVDYPMYAAFRDPRYFWPCPDTFWPDRWIKAAAHPRAVRFTGLDDIKRYSVLPRSAPEKTNANGPFANVGVDTKGEDEDESFAHNAAAFLPFAHGPTNCAGRGLAIVELRVITAMLVRRFIFKPSDEFNPVKFIDDVNDYFLTRFGKLKMNIERRGRA